MARASGVGRGNEQESEGLLLRAVDYGDADRVCTFLFPDAGKRALFAKNARSKGKRFRGGIGPFTLLRARWVDKGEGKLATLRESEVVQGFHRIPADLAKLAAGSWALEVVDAMLERHQGAGEFYDTVRRFLVWLDAEPNGDARVECGVHRFVLMLLFDAGVLPPLDASVRTGASLEGHATVWMPGEGIVLASERRPGESGIALAEGASTYLAALASGRFPASDRPLVRAGVRRALAEEVRRHAGMAQKSYALFDELFAASAPND